jgi:hypothetical protein
MFDTIAGLPLHPLVVHATEVIVPSAALAVMLAALWPMFRRWARYLPLGLSLASVALVPLSTQSGEALRDRIGESSLIETHASLAGGLLPWVIGLAVVAGALAWWHRNERSGTRPRAPRWIAVVLAVAAVLATTGTTAQAIRVGHSGAQAVWSPVVGSTAPAGSGDDG